MLLNRTFALYALLTVLATLNRESGLILAFIYLTYHGRSHLRSGLALVAIWAGITTGLHIILGPSLHVNGSLLGMLAFNISNAADAGMCFLILFPIYYLTFKGYKGADVRFKRLAWVGVAYMVASWVGGNWGESQRYLLVCLPLILPIILSQERNLTRPALTT